MDGEAEAQVQAPNENQTPTDDAKPDRKSSEGFIDDDEESDEPILDKKQLLYKMLEKQTGGAKTTFNFEEDEGIQAPRDGEAQRGRGRPAREAQKNGQ